MICGRQADSDISLGWVEPTLDRNPVVWYSENTPRCVTRCAPLGERHLPETVSPLKDLLH
jgi:hypothetical protein